MNKRKMRRQEHQRRREKNSDPYKGRRLLAAALTGDTKKFHDELFDK